MISLSKLNPHYRITLDESWHYERPEVRKADRRWYEQIPCRGGGFISLCSENPPMLHLWTPQIKSARAISRKMPELEVEWLDGEAVIYFPPELLDRVAEMAGVRKKRQGRKLSSEEKAKLVESGKAYRFSGNSTGPQIENLPQI